MSSAVPADISASGSPVAGLMRLEASALGRIDELAVDEQTRLDARARAVAAIACQSLRSVFGQCLRDSSRLASRLRIRPATCGDDQRIDDGAAVRVHDDGIQVDLARAASPSAGDERREARRGARRNRRSRAAARGGGCAAAARIRRRSTQPAGLGGIERRQGVHHVGAALRRARRRRRARPRARTARRGSCRAASRRPCAAIIGATSTRGPMRFARSWYAVEQRRFVRECRAARRRDRTCGRCRAPRS